MVDSCTAWGIPLSAICKSEVDTITFENLIQEYNITQVNYLKIDTEGHDCVILNDVLDMSKRDGRIYAPNIRFETNKLSKRADVEDVIHKARGLGYLVQELPIFGETFLTTNSKLNNTLSRSSNEPQTLKIIQAAMSF